ncbi:MAG TPA: SRPBCC family protein [Planctomycetaceae bacterium]|nr:SRPBCC family protein [Planctomycetaceae bacterium]
MTFDPAASAEQANDSSASKASPGGRPTIQIGPSPTGRGFRLEASQWLPRLREELFEFFADAFQLQTITPKWLHFVVLTPLPIRIAAGTLIDYRLRLHGIPIRWRTRISAWEPCQRFVDEQIRGPYRCWHHEHTFETVEGGTLCRDIVDYAVWGGRAVDALVVRRDLRRIFGFRQLRLQELFSQKKNPLKG